MVSKTAVHRRDALSCLHFTGWTAPLGPTPQFLSPDRAVSRSGMSLRQRAGYQRIRAADDDVRPPHCCAASQPLLRAHRRNPGLAPSVDAPARLAPQSPHPPTHTHRPCQDWRANEDLRFAPPPEEVPWGSIALAAALTAIGAAAFVLAWLHWTAALFGKEQAVGRAARRPPTPRHTPRAVPPGPADAQAASAVCECSNRTPASAAVSCAAADRPPLVAPASQPPASEGWSSLSPCLPTPPRSARARAPRLQEIGFSLVGLLTFVPGAQRRRLRRAPRMARAAPGWPAARSRGGTCLGVLPSSAAARGQACVQRRAFKPAMCRAHQRGAHRSWIACQVAPRPRPCFQARTTAGLRCSAGGGRPGTAGATFPRTDEAAAARGCLGAAERRRPHPIVLR